ncbi:ATP-binding protein [Candidatus Neomarinimicrobiota bacterium]
MSEKNRSELENKLAETEATLELITDSFSEVVEKSAEGIIVVNMSGDLKYANSLALRIFGKSFDELKNEEFEVRHLIGKNTEIQLTRSDGSQGVGDMYVTKLNWYKKPAYMISIIDITDRKNIEDSYIQLYENAPVGYHEIDRSGKIVQVNKTEAKMLGYTRNDMVGKMLWDFMEIDSPSVEVIKAKMKGVTLPSKDLERAFIKKNKERITILAEDQMLQNDQNRIIGMRSTMQDITYRKKTLDEVRRLSNFPLRHPTPIIEMDFHGNNTYINPAGLALLDKMNLSEKDISRILPANYRELLTSSQEMTIQTEEVTLDENVLLWSINILEDLQLVHFYATDITELKKTEIALITAKEKAEASDKLKNIFLSTMSHEVRTPLNVILGYTDLLALELQDKVPDDMKLFFSDIQESGDRLKKLIDDIMDISMIEADQTILKFEILKVNDLLEQSVIKVSEWAKKKNLKIKTSITNKNIEIKVDKNRFLQAIGNLLNNAVKFTEKGSIELLAFEKNDQIYINIIDTGIGIKEEFLPTLFTVFRQAEEGFERKYEGAGLGLAISNRLITAMGGEISIDSKVNSGSTFSIQLPNAASMVAPDVKISEEISMDQEVTKALRNISRKATSKVKSPKTLIVEDNPANLEYIEYLLRKLNIDCVTSPNADAAWHLLQNNQINCMLIDISLSDSISGIEFLEMVRNESKYAGILAIAVTAHALKGDRKRFLDLGFDDYLSKPFILEDLKDILDKHSTE